MSVQAALQFIHQARGDGALRENIESAGADDGLERLAALGAKRGLEFSPEELRAAHTYDWRMRWHHYRTRHEYQESSRVSDGSKVL